MLSYSRSALVGAAIGLGVVGGISLGTQGERANRGARYIASTALVEADTASLEEAGYLKLQAGMPAEVYIEGSAQTALQYLAEPIAATVRKAGREM